MHLYIDLAFSVASRSARSAGLFYRSPLYILIFQIHLLEMSSLTLKCVLSFS